MKGKQEDIFRTQTRKIQQCNCGHIPGKKTILTNFCRVGITTEFLDNGVFKNNHELYIENNFCPQCGKKYKDQ